MSNLVDRTAYLRGLAEGMNLSKEKNENKLMLEMLSVMDEMAQKINEMGLDMEELDEYMESIDEDLTDMEEVLFGDEDDDADDGDDEYDFNEDEELSLDCPHCGSSIQLKSADIDFDQSPLCPKCEKPFFSDILEGEDEE